MKAKLRPQRITVKVSEVSQPSLLVESPIVICQVANIMKLSKICSRLLTL